jgi:hypothetical protein
MNFKEFDAEHEEFCQRLLDGNGDKLGVDSLWLALYYARPDLDDIKSALW